MSSVVDTFSARLEELVGRFAEVVRRVGRRHRLSDGDVDDLLQEVRIRLWRANAEKSERIEQVSASYVYRTAMSAAIDLLRRRRARGVEQTVSLEEGLEAASNAPTPSSGVELSQLAGQLEECIQSITASRRPVVRMYLAGETQAEIAALMGWSEAKTRNLLYRGLSDLRERLASMGITCLMID